MNIENLKLILEHLSGLGAEAKSAFIWWLLLQHVPPFLLWCTFFGLVAFVARLVFRHLHMGQAAKTSEAERAVDAVRAWWLHGAPDDTASKVEMHKLYCKAVELAKAQGHRAE